MRTIAIITIVVLNGGSLVRARRQEQKNKFSIQTKKESA